jgi:hypothetical protein
LFDKTQHAGLFSTISALKISQNLNPDTYTFSSAANHLAAEVFQLPGFQSMMGRKLSALETSGGVQGACHNGVIFIGFHKDWRQQTHEERDAKSTKCKRLGIKPGASKKGHKESAATKKEQKVKKELREEVAVAKRMIVALSQWKDPAPEEEAVAADAGITFDGQAEKKLKKS